MDYELENDYMGCPSAKFSMGHEAFGRWFTEELSKDLILMDKILSSIAQIEGSIIVERVFSGTLFELTVDIESASVLALSLAEDSEAALDDNLQLFDNELMSDCGLTDFKEALIAWQEFIS